MIRPPRALEAVQFVESAFWELVAANDLTSIADAFQINQEILAFTRAFHPEEVLEFRQGTPQSFQIDNSTRQKIAEKLSKRIVQIDGAVIERLHRIDADGRFALKSPTGDLIEGLVEERSKFDDLHELLTSSEDAD